MIIFIYSIVNLNMFNNFRYLPKKLYIAPIPIIYPNKTFYQFNNKNQYTDFACYKLIKELCYY